MLAMFSTVQSKRACEFWKSGLVAASRTALACIIVGCLTLYGPASFKREVTFPAFSYVAMILIITNATLGDTIRGLWLAFYATLQTVCPAILCLWLIGGPSSLTEASTSLVVAIAAFFIALPQSTHVVAKRIALGQLIIIYVVGYINAHQFDAVMHPVHVAASTAVGAVACFLALLLPYPHLASSQVTKNSKLFVENATDRLKLFVKAFCAQDDVTSQALISQTRCLAGKAKKFIQCIKSKQESMQWERFPLKFIRPYCTNPGDRFQELETPLRGMDIALSNTKVPISIVDEQLKDGMDLIEGEISQNLHQLKSHTPSETITVPESTEGQVMGFLQKLETPPSNEKDLPSYFFFFCMKLLHSQSRAMTIPPNQQKTDQNTPQKKNQQQHLNKNNENQNGFSLKSIWANNWPTAKERLTIAINCSLSLGFSVLFGLYYSKPNGYWSGLPVAVSFAAAREATFKVANVKFQGTVIGNVYGVLGCFIFERFVQIRFISLLPWFIFTSFLQQSKMYGQAGAVSAVIGAILILGRRNFGPPSDFAIARIVETFIGLSCSIVIDLLLHPTRGATLAKVQLTKTLGTLEDSISSIDLVTSSKVELLEKAKSIKAQVNELDKYVGEAEAEPNFWYLPFHTSCYRKLMGPFAKMGDLLIFTAHAIGFLEEHIQSIELERMNDDLRHVVKMVATSMKSFQEVASIKSLIVLENDLAKSGKRCDLEVGKSANFPLMNLGEKDMEKFISSYLDHSKEVFEEIEFPEGDEEIKSQAIMSLSALGFCLSCLMRETKEVEKGIKELVQWENPTSQINLHEMSCKIHALYD
ncbi:uncharacterized protein LOC110684092 [Chenopodium quinoa]|uniref:uncharacterized protein LOC110684092 n=1 Tax=Chenopodium quinoa TaxID=63459 RepID=UPI000B78F375|nr:uncharacterized protein LOC110684092 [Chenopodium quinoa]